MKKSGKFSYCKGQKPGCRPGNEAKLPFAMYPMLNKAQFKIPVQLLQAISTAGDGIGSGNDIPERQLLQSGASGHAQRPKQLMPVVGREHLPSHILQQRQQYLCGVPCNEGYYQ